MKRARLSLVSVAAGLLMAALLAATATAATMSVTAAIKQQDRQVQGSRALHRLQDFHGTTPASVKKIIPAVTALATKFDHAALVVSKASATTSAQKAGQRDWVKGVRTEAVGLRQLDTAFKDVSRKDKAGAKAAAKKAIRTLEAGGKTVAKGDRLLGLPSSD